MRRLTVMTVLFLLLAGLTAVFSTPATPSQAAPLPVHLEYLGSERPDNIPFSINATADRCYEAPELTLPGGDVSGVFYFTETATDPVLSCAWGSPPPPRGKQGYRTAWYKFQPGRSGVVTIETLGSNFDTILAVHTGNCTQAAVDLTMVACNDDYNGFSSRLTLSVRRGTTYYVEVADWQFDPPFQPTIELAAWLEPVDSAWDLEGIMPVPRSRHMMVGVGPDIYVVGGVEQFGFPLNLTSSVQRFNTPTRSWHTHNSIPIPDGVANTTAVYLDGKIFIPGGFTGNVNTFNNTHWVFDTATGSWSTATSPTWPGRDPMAWATAVVPKTSALPQGYFLIGGTDDVPPFDPPYTTPIAQPSSEVLYYFVNDDQWDTTSFTDLTTPRFAHMAGWVGGRVCVVGGLTAGASSNEILAGGECYQNGLWRPVASLNIPRYAAGSAVGPDGKWYIFGGIATELDADGDPVAVAVEATEVYNPATNTWTLLGAAYDLGDFVNSPPRAWPQGVFVGNTLWAMGGNEVNENSDIVPLMEKLQVYTQNRYLPFLRRAGTVLPPNNTFAAAYRLLINQPQFHNFDDILDIYDVYFFDLASPGTVSIRLSDISDTSDYNLALFNTNKLLLENSTNPGSQEEIIQRTLSVGRYYLMVERVFPAGPPDTDNYRIVVQR